MCVAKTTAPFAQCIAHDGEVACPPGFGARTVAGTPRDPRTCPSSCTCRAAAACDPNSPVAPLRLSKDTACTQPITFLRADGGEKPFDPGPGPNATCEIDPEGSTVTVAAYQWDYPNVACTAAAADLPADPGDGGLLADTRTICCAAPR